MGTPEQTVKLLSDDLSTIVEPWKTLITAVAAANFLKPNEELAIQGTEYHCESPHFWGTKYSSNSNQTDFKDSSAVINDPNEGVLMGLADSSTAPTSFLDVQHAFSVPDVISGSLGTIINTLKDQITVAIDTEGSGNGNGNGLWIIPKDSSQLEVVTKLTFQITGGEIKAWDRIAQNLHDDFGLNVPQADVHTTAGNVKIILKETATFTVGGSSPDVAYSVTVKLPNIKGFVFWISQSANETGFALTELIANPGQSISTLKSISDDAALSNPTLPEVGGGFDVLHLWYADLRFSGSKKYWSIAFIIDLTINTSPLKLYMTYDTEKKSFSGGVLLKKSLPVDPDRLSPKYRDYHGLPVGLVVPDLVQVDSLLGVTFPSGLPNRILQGTVAYTAADSVTRNPASLHLTIEIGSGSKGNAPTVPAPFNWKDTKFIFHKDNKTTWKLTSNFELTDPSGRYKETGTLDLDVEHTDENGGHFEITGTAEKVNFGVLAGFFDGQFSGAMDSVLGKLVVEKLVVAYTYDTNGQAAAFVFTGDIIFGKLRLQMFYQYSSKNQPTDNLLTKLSTLTGKKVPDGVKSPPTQGNDSAWAFDAYLSDATPGSKIGDIIESITGDRVLPDFIADIPVDPPSGDPNIITIRAAIRTVEDVEKLVSVFEVKINIVTFSFVQIAGNTGVPKRVLRFSVGPLPFISSIPVVKELPPPYQLLTYCWVGAEQGDSLTVDEIKFLNDNYIPQDKIYYMDEVQNQTTGLRPGNHFIIVNDDKCILDHVFSTGQAPTPAPTSTLAVTMLAVAPPAATTEPTAEPENPPTKGALKKQTDLLSITAISVQYKQNALWLFIDCTIKLGPIELDLIGFGIGLTISGPTQNKVTLHDLTNVEKIKNALTFQLHGLAMDFNQPPIMIAGVFEHEKTAIMDSYRGGIGVKFEPYDLAAVGEYAEITQAGDNYKSIFIFAKLDGPLVDLEIAIIKGVRLGFGYNSFVRSPTVQELPQFPFINDVGLSGAGNNPMLILQAMRSGDNPWVQVKHNALWFAFGFSVSAFDIITATAVALLQFSDQGVVVDIYADVIGQMPPDAPSLDECILYVELLMNAELNFIYDYFFVQAALAPTSFLLVPQCHLYGGFACGSWFGRSDYAGDWVYTVGGYHKQFPVPQYYPKPDRLGISFNIGDNMTIRGEGYFAICPKAVMGGALIFIQLSVGPVRAHLDAGFDALVQFHPLHYIVEFHVDVGVSCHVHVAFVSFDVGLDIGALLHIEGPNFGGVAHVDFWFFGFDVYFGDSPHKPPPLHLSEFYAIVAKAGPQPSGEKPPKEDHVEEDLDIQLKFSLEDGAFPKRPADKHNTPPDSTGAGAKWIVRGGTFEFRVSSVFAMSSATVDGLAVAAATWVDGDGNKHGVGAIMSVPMQTSAPIGSPVTVVVKRVRQNQAAEVLKTWQPAFVVKTVPTALWGDPTHPPNALDASQAGTVPLAMAVSASAPPPILAISKIPPVSATAIARQLVRSATGANYILAPTETQSGFFPSTAPLSSSSIDVEEKKKAWAATQKTWEGMAEVHIADLAKELVDGCISALGWDKPAPEVVQRVKDEKASVMPWALGARFPDRLVSGGTVKEAGVDVPVDGLVNTYLALPRVIAV